MRKSELVEGNGFDKDCLGSTRIVNRNAAETAVGRLGDVHPLKGNGARLGPNCLLHDGGVSETVTCEIITKAHSDSGISFEGKDLAGRTDEVRGYDVLGTSAFLLGLTGLVLGVSRGGLSGWNDSTVIAGLLAAAVLLPAWVAIERRSRAPMLDLRIFRNRLFAAATAAAFINGLARFALMFLFVFYFQGAQGNSPIAAGIKLTPLALGMLLASPLAGIHADRHGSRTLACVGMLVSAAGLAGMSMLTVGTPYWQSGLWLLIVGAGSGMFNSPNTAAMMGTVPAHRRGVAAGARTLLQNTGAVLSIAFVLAIVTSAVPKATLFAVFSGLARGLSERKLAPFIHNMHVALWVLAATSLIGAAVCLLRPRHARSDEQADALARIAPA